MILVIEIRFHLEIADVDFGRRPQINVPENAAQTPHVLILKVRAIAPAEILHREQILAWLEILGYVELNRSATILAQTDFFAIDPEIEKRVYSIESDQHPAPIPFFRNNEGSAVGIDGIVRIVFRHYRRLGFDPVPRPGITNVHIDPDAVT